MPLRLRCYWLPPIRYRGTVIFTLDFPQAYLVEWPRPSAIFRQSPEDFFVNEVLGFDLTGEGEHIALHIEKCGHNTHWVAAELARYAGVAERDVGVCGRKDRHAVTRQWFSLYDPHVKPIDWSSFHYEGVRIVDVTRHNKKLRPGMHQHNQFTIRLRQVQIQGQPLTYQQKQALSLHIQHCFDVGVPNLFGPQRFGRDGNNLGLAEQWFLKQQPPPRKQRGMVLSAARAYLFNCVLAERIRQGNWLEVIDGDCVQESLPTGPLWGRGRLATQGQAKELEQSVLEPFTRWCDRLEHQGLAQERRSLVLQPSHASHQWDQEDLIVRFELVSGAFATAVLAEISELKAADKAPDVV